MNPLEIGICSWSIDSSDLVGAIETAKREHGLAVMHVGIFDETTIERVDVESIRTAASEADVAMCATFVGFEGLDRTSIASVRRTGGLRLDDRFEDRLALLARGAKLTKSLGAGMMAAHLGAVPSDDRGREFSTLVDRVRIAADAAAEQDVTLLAETGQESAAVLRDFLATVDRDNVGVNFDPGNMIILGTGDPVKAVSTLADRVRLVHLKDAVASVEPGVDWGREVKLGSGDANIPRVISKLRARGYGGPLLVERRLSDGETHRGDVDFVRSMLC